MEQLTIDDAIEQAESGMQRALEHADQEVRQWSDLAYTFLIAFCQKHPSFISEDVSDASKEWGMVQPPTDRAWGSLYKRAKAAGIIEVDGTGRSRRRHASVCIRWRSRIAR